MAAALAFTGCVPDEKPKLLLPSGIMAGNPIDTTVEGELPVGNLDAFGLTLPRRMRIQAEMDDAIYALGRLRLEDVTNYIRRRVETDRIETGPSKTVFYDASIKSVPDKVVEVEVSIVSRGVQVIVRDKTKPPAEEGVSQEEFYRRAGLKPDGKTPLDNLE